METSHLVAAALAAAVDSAEEASAVEVLAEDGKALRELEFRRRIRFGERRRRAECMLLSLSNHGQIASQQLIPS